MIRVAICDDNKPTVKQLEKILRGVFPKYAKDVEIHSFYSGISFLNQHKIEPFNVVFLDIDMPSVTGFDVAKSIRNMCTNSYIIFVTSHSELVYDSLDFQPFHFIRKSCETPLLLSVDEVVVKLMKHIKQFQRIVLEDQEGRKTCVYMNEIVYLESDKHYVNFYLANRSDPIKLRGVLSEYEKKYAEYDFIRIHKRYLINLKYLSFLDTKRDEVLLGTLNRRLIMSRNYKKTVDEKYTDYLRSTV